MQSRALLILSLVLGSVLPAAMAPDVMAPDVTRMDQVAQSFTANNQFMGCILVARGDEVLISRGYGSANLEWNIANTPTTRFRIASVTKQFTAAAILLLEERRALKLDDPIGKYLPDAPAAWKKITFFNLLTHTSGIGDLNAFPELAAFKVIHSTPEDLVGKFRDKPLLFAPGAGYRYSNLGYILLGYLIERISGKPYATFVRENFFDPLGMKDSGYDSNSEIIPHRAAGYSRSRNGLTNAPFIDMSVPFAAGGLFSTTEDLLRWERGLFGGRLLSAESLRKMTTPCQGGYGLGLGIVTGNGRRLFSHEGAIEGFNAYLGYYPDEQVTVVVLGNLAGQAPEAIGNYLGALAHREQVRLPSERTEIAMSPMLLQQYVGTYVMENGERNQVTLEGRYLATQIAGRAKFQLLPEAADKFFIKDLDRQFEFVRNAKGVLTTMVLHQGAATLPARRQ